MTFRVLLPILLLFAAFESLRGDQPLKQDFADLKRLSSVLELSSFPTPSQDGVRFWFQESDSRGIGKTIDIDEFPLNATLNFFGIKYAKTKSLDLDSIAIISDEGLAVRFVNFHRTIVKRGDVVAFLLSKEVKAQREWRATIPYQGDTAPDFAGILLLDQVDARSLLPLLNEIRSSCGEPELTLGVDESKNAIVFGNSTSSNAETIAKLRRWIRNVEPGKLRKR